jgi:DNA helicase-2/ATP-dependent DNA helicase PcrA
MHQGIDAFNILSLTFTNKAAREMKKRISDVGSSEAKNLWMGTFHSVFARILRSEADKVRISLILLFMTRKIHSEQFREL